MKGRCLTVATLALVQLGCPKITPPKAKDSQVKTVADAAVRETSDAGAHTSNEKVDVLRVGVLTLGKLKLGITAAEVGKAFGAPAEKTAFAKARLSGAFHRSWRYPAKGVSLEMVREKPDAEEIVLGIDVGPSSTLKTSQGVGIGSTVAAVHKAYPVEGVGSFELIVSYQAGKVVHLFYGRGAPAASQPVSGGDK